MSRRRPERGGRRYPREARLNELIREIVAEELERIDAAELEWVSVSEVRTDSDLTHATVFVSTLDDDSDEQVLRTLEQHRPRLQAAIGRQARVRRTPPLVFEIDRSLREAERIDRLLDGITDPDESP